MTHPFWIINSSLLMLCAYASFFVYATRVKIPEREDIEPLLYSKPKTEHHVAINIKHIYENDLFGTYRKESPSAPAPVAMPLPTAPEPQRMTIPEAPKPTFLEPLNITLKGIIVVSSDERKNRALITDNKTDLESMYKIGDTLQDAQLVRIFNNKIILLRANGQQEVLYLREQDAQNDPAFTQVDNWITAIIQKAATSYVIKPQVFIKRVENLSRFIELLNLTTAYQKGDPVGTRIGNVAPNSLGAYLGLRTNDIILSIDSIPATTLDNRLNIYNKITNAKAPYSFFVELLRTNRPLRLEYTIEQPKTEVIKSLPPLPTQEEQKLVEKTMEAEEPLNDTFNFDQEIMAPEFEGEEIFAAFKQNLRNRETKNMLTHGKLKPVKSESIKR